MSSKCDRSVKTPSREEKDEDWKEDDLEDLELVRPGGEPGGCAKVVISSLWSRMVRVRSSGLGRASVKERRREILCSVRGATVCGTDGNERL